MVLSDGEAWAFLALILIGVVLIILVPILIIWAFNVVVLHPFGRHLDTNLWTWLAMVSIMITVRALITKNEEEN